MILVFCGRSFGCSLGRPTINIPILLGWLAHHSSFGVLHAAEKIDGNTKNIIAVLLHGYKLLAVAVAVPFLLRYSSARHTDIHSNNNKYDRSSFAV